MSLEGPFIPAQSGNTRSLVIFLHGYGADGNDLITLGAQLAQEMQDTAFVSPNAPHPLEGAFGGRQWFPITFRNSEEFWEGAEDAKPYLEDFITNISEGQSIPFEKIALVGFSQGTMMALHVGLRLEKKLAGIVGFSGLLPKSERQKEGVGTYISPCPVLLVHGDADEVVPVDATHIAEKQLKQNKIEVNKIIRPNLGHGIDPQGLGAAAAFLKTALGYAE